MPTPKKPQMDSSNRSAHRAALADELAALWKKRSTKRVLRNLMAMSPLQAAHMMFMLERRIPATDGPDTSDLFELLGEYLDTHESSEPITMVLK